MSEIIDEGCSCHINPPCEFCVQTYECVICAARVTAEEELEGAVESERCNRCYMGLQQDA
jgi:hypothetical protein